MISDSLFKIYVLIVAYLMWVILITLATYQKQQRHWQWYLVANVIILGGIAVGYPLSIKASWYQIALDWLPLALLIVCHRETSLLTRLFYPHTLDQKIIQWEQRLFSENPCYYLSRRFNSGFGCEFLHFCYFSFYAMIYGIPLYFYCIGAYSAFYQTVFAELFLLFSCYITHGLVPASGPRNIFTKINDTRTQGLWFRIVHKVLEDGSTHATAFPSGHVGIAFVVLLVTWHLHTPLFYLVLPFSLGLIISTVYGRFHYVTDVLFGLLYATLAFWMSVWVIS